MKHPFKPVYRPPVELWSAALFYASSAVVFLHPGFFFLDQLGGVYVAVCYAAFATYRTSQAVHVLRAQLNLRPNGVWQIRTDRIPRKRGMLFLGRGYKWTQKQTQSLFDAQSFLQKKGIMQEFILRKGGFLSRADASLPIGGKAEIHGVELNEKNAWMRLSDRVGHTLVLGTTRVGKTRLAELLITQDIHRGEVVIVFDPKGDTALLSRMYHEAERCERLEHFQFFHLGYPEASVRYNAIGRFSRVTEVATRIANQLPSQGNSAAFKEFAWRFVNIIAGALVELKVTPNYRLIRKYINDIEPLFVNYAEHLLARKNVTEWQREVKRLARNLSQGMSGNTIRGRDIRALAIQEFLQSNPIDDPVLEGLMSAYKYDRTYYDKIVSSVGPLMEKLTTGAIADLISPNETVDDDRPIFNWLDAIRNRGIVYIGLDSLTDPIVASAVGNSMFADLVSIAGHIYKFGVHENRQQVRVTIHADEFNELIGEEFVPLLNKAGGAGFQVTAYTQTWSDVEAKIGSRAKSGQVVGNFNSLIMMRVKELATAELMTKQLPRTKIRSVTTASAASDSNSLTSTVDFESKTQDSVSSTEVPLLSPNDLFTLPRGHAFALLDGGQLWKLRFPMLHSEIASGDDPDRAVTKMNPPLLETKNREIHDFQCKNPIH